MFFVEFCKRSKELTRLLESGDDLRKLQKLRATLGALATSMKEFKLQGFVTSLRDVRPFSLYLNEHSSYFIASYLWDVTASANNSQA